MNRPTPASIRTRLLRWYDRFGPIVTGIVAAVATAAIIYAFLANQHATRVAHQQAIDAQRLAAVAQAQSQVNTDRLTDDARLFCGGFVPISKAKSPQVASPLGLAIKDWATRGAIALNCPGR